MVSTKVRDLPIRLYARRGFRAALLGAAVLAAMGANKAQANSRMSAAKCAMLTGAVTNGTIVSATWTPADEQRPAACAVRVQLSSEPGSRINALLLLPARWNGRLLGIGIHGFGGYIPEKEMQRSLARGFAVFGSDTGHSGSPLDASWMAVRGPAWQDFGWRATHLATQAAKDLVKRAYGRAQRFAYFQGCSTGGRLAMREAQSFPQDFDGVIVGAAPLDWTGVLTQQLWAAHQVRRDGTATPGWIAPERYPAITAATLAQCDALDGVKDGLVTDPRRCTATVRALQCKPGERDDCLTAAQVGAIDATYAPLTDPKSGAHLFDGLEPTSETAWVSRLGSHVGPGPHVTGYFSALFGAGKWDWRVFDLAADLARARELDRSGAQIDSLATDLASFRRHGGKIIQYHGWLDPAMAPRFYPHFYEAVGASTTAGDLDALAEFYRLFMVPGMYHCFGGPGPNSFGGAEQSEPPKIDAAHDVLSAMVAWVESGRAPDRLIATQYRNDEPARGIVRQMPLCPYPKAARWDGRGRVEQASSYQCALSAPSAKVRP